MGPNSMENSPQKQLTTNDETFNQSSDINMQQQSASPFERSSLVMRSPLKGKSNTPATQISQKHNSNNKAADYKSFFFRKPPDTPTSDSDESTRRQRYADELRGLENLQSSPNATKQPHNVRRLVKLVERLGKEIDGLQTYVTQKTNVHNDIKRMCSTIKRAHTDVTMQLEKEDRMAAAAAAQTKTATTVSAPATTVAATTAVAATVASTELTTSMIQLSSKATAGSTSSLAAVAATDAASIVTKAKKRKAKASPRKTTQETIIHPEAKKRKEDIGTQAIVTDSEWQKVKKEEKTA